MNHGTKRITTPGRNIPVLGQADVIVIGGSPTGVAAAVAAARAGAVVMLVERFGHLGGQMTSGLMLTMHRPFWDAHGNRIVDGLPVEILQRAMDHGGTPDTPAMLETEGAPYWGDGWTATAIDPEVTKRVLQEMLEEAGIQLWLDVWVSEAVVRDNSVEGVILETRSGPTALLCDVIVDATGDAHVAALAGAEYASRHPNHFAPNLVGRIRGVNLPRLAAFIADNYDDIEPHPEGLSATAFRKWIEAGRVFGVIGFHTDIEAAQEEDIVSEQQVRLGFLHLGQGECMLWRNNLRRVDVLDPRDLSDSYLEGHRRIWDAIDFYRRFVPGMEEIRLTDTATAMGVRETRRLLGVYTLTEDDVLESRRFEDTVCRSAGHDSHNDLQDGVCDVPYRCLLPETLDQLLVAGRSISTTTPHALDSIRGVVPCICTGQSAGIAAALAARTNRRPRDLEYGELREELLRQGVIL